MLAVVEYGKSRHRARPMQISFDTVQLFFQLLILDIDKNDQELYISEIWWPQNHEDRMQPEIRHKDWAGNLCTSESNSH